MEKIFLKIEKYLKKHVADKPCVRTDDIFLNFKKDNGVELYGFDSIKILVKQEEDRILYKPIFNN